MVITFYSYKGGVGRTQLLANTAVGLANRGLRVAMIDMDLESPGLHNYFYREIVVGKIRPLSSEDLSTRPGLIDALESHMRDGQSPPDIGSIIESVKHPNLKKGELWLLPAGRMDPGYPHLVASFPWERFYSEASGYAYMEYLRHALLEGDSKWRGVDVVLIDSRTGLTDVSSICTGQLPNILVVLFGLHVQGIEGARHIARAVKHYTQSPQTTQRLQHIYLLPSRVEESGSLEERDRMLKYAAESLFELGELLNGLDDRLAYDPRIAYGEQVILGGKSEPTNLSRAYERLVERIVTLMAPAKAIIQQTASRPITVPAELIAAMDTLTADVAVAAELGRAARTSSLETLANKTHRLMDVYRAAQSDYAKVRRTINEMVVAENSIAVNISHLPEGLPEHEGEWSETLRQVNAACEEATQAWIESWGGRVQSRLQSSDNPIPEIEKLLSDLKDRARRESAETLENLVSETERFLQRDSLNQLLKEKKLTLDELKRVIPNSDSRATWLEHRLTRLQEEGDLSDESTVNQLWNVLQLLSAILRESGRRPEAVHWSAYDILCMAVSSGTDTAQTSSLEISCFEDVGRRVWETEWNGLLAQKRLTDPDWPCGLEARRQLNRISHVPGKINALSELVADGLAAGSYQNADLQRIVQLRRDDPILEGAILKLGVDSSVPNRREILATWLSILPQQASPNVVSTFLHALSDDGFEAEAFYAGCAVLARSPQFFDGELPLWLDVVAKFILVLAEKRRFEALSGLLSEPDVLNLLPTSLTGKAILAALAVYPWRSWSFDPSVFGMLRGTILNKMGTILPNPVLGWLESPASGDSRDTRSWLEVKRLNDEVLGRTDITIFKDWDGAVYLESAFRSHWLTIYQEVSQDRRPLAEIEALHLRESAGDWIEQTFKTLRNERKRISRPEGRGRRNLVDAYTEIVNAILTTLKARPYGHSINQVLRSLYDHEHAVNALKHWLIEEGSATGSVTLKRIAEFLERAGDE